MSKARNAFHYLLQYGNKDFLLRMTQPDRTKLLHTVVQSGPSEASWNALLELFAAWPEAPEKAAALAWADERLDAWEEPLRHVNSAWGILYDGNALASLVTLVRSISISRRDDSGNQELRKIAESPFTKNLRRLKIERSNIYAEGIRALVSPGALPRLASLALHGVPLSDGEFAVLAGTAGLTALSAFSFTSAGLGGDGFTRLLGSPLLEQLAHLDLSYNFLDDDQVLRLLQSGRVNQLKYLNLSGNQVRGIAAKAVAGPTRPSNLQELNLSDNPIAAEAREQLRNMAAGSGLRLILD